MLRDRFLRPRGDELSNRYDRFGCFGIMVLILVGLGAITAAWFWLPETAPFWLRVVLSVVGVILLVIVTGWWWLLEFLFP